jgi:hypothetical protein
MHVSSSPPTGFLPPCEERQRLRDAYERAAQEHLAAVNEVLGGRGRVPQEQYERVRAAADEAKSKRDLARLVLLQHKREHGC